MKLTKIVLSICIAGLLCTNAFTQNKASDLDGLKNELSLFVDSLMAKKKIAGISIALVDNQELVWSKGFGLSDRENEKKVTPETIYLTCSMSKIFTATTVMQLAGNGKIDIDKPIETYIPEFAIKSRFDNPGTITARNILSHHSGLPSDFEYQWGSENPPPFTTVVDLFNEAYTCTQPNTVFSYSNEGYSLLGVLIERASGKSFYEYTQNHLFKPLNMQKTSFGLSDNQKKDFTKSYVDGKEYNTLSIRAVPAGWHFSNVMDISNFIKMMFNDGMYDSNQILKSDILNEMQAQQNKNCKLDMDFQIGLGWWLKPNVWGYGGKYIEHGGDYMGFHSQMGLLSDHKIGVVVLTNTDKGAKAVRTIAEKFLKSYLKYKKGISDTNKVEENLNFGNITYLPTDSITGDWVVSGQGALQFKTKKDKLFAKTSLGKLKLTPNENNLYSTKAIILGFIPLKLEMQFFFSTIDNVDYVFMKNKMYDALAVGKRTSKTPIPQIWKNRIGEYKNINEDLKYSHIQSLELYKKNDYLYAKTIDYTGGKAKVVLKIISDKQVIIDGVGRGTGNTVYFKDDEVYWGGIRLKKTK